MSRPTSSPEFTPAWEITTARLSAWRNRTKNIPTGKSIFIWIRAWTACGICPVFRTCCSVSAFQRRRARTPAEEGAAGLCGVAVGRRRREHSFDFGHRSHFCCQLRSINARQRFCTDFGVLVIHMSDKRGAFNRSMQRRTETLEASLRRGFFGPSTRHSEKWARQPDLQQRVRGRGMRGRPREVLELPKNRLEMHATHRFLYFFVGGGYFSNIFETLFSIRATYLSGLSVSVSSAIPHQTAFFNCGSTSSTTRVPCFTSGLLR